MWIFVNLIVLSLSGVLLDISTSIRWVDHISKDDMDIFYDRVVFIIMEKGTQIGLAPGVLIDNITVLTSFNPFREHIKEKDARKKVHISILYERHITDWNVVNYTLKNYSIDCARQIIPIDISDDIWHNQKKEQSPLHDLMVIRLNESVALIPDDPSLYSFSNFGHSGRQTQTAGPMITQLPRRNKLGRQTLQFASLGFIDSKHITKSFLLRSHSYDAEENVEANCNSWIPREWGVFICIRNNDRFKGVGSGAVLFANNMLFGIGSFMLKKGKDSILVFTDVRQYRHLIFDTCTIEDQLLQDKTTTSTTAAP